MGAIYGGDQNNIHWLPSLMNSIKRYKVWICDGYMAERPSLAKFFLQLSLFWAMTTRRKKNDAVYTDNKLRDNKFHKQWTVKRKKKTIAVRCTRAHARACGVSPVWRGLLVPARTFWPMHMHLDKTHELLLLLLLFKLPVFSSLRALNCAAHHAVIGMGRVGYLIVAKEFLTEKCIRDSSLYSSAGVNKTI